MKGKDIQAGAVYAVVRSRSQGCEKRAVPAEVATLSPDGRFLVRFAEPMHVSYWSFEPVTEEVSWRDPQFPDPLEEFELDSRQILALWDEHEIQLAEQERREQAQKQRSADEEEMVKAALSALLKALAGHGAALAQQSAQVGWRQVDKQSFRVCQLLLDIPEAEALCAAAQGRAARQLSALTLERLAADLSAIVSALGYSAADERTQISASYAWRQSGYTHCLQAFLPAEVAFALADAVCGEEHGPAALSALLEPLVG